MNVTTFLWHCKNMSTLESGINIAPWIIVASRKFGKRISVAPFMPYTYYLLIQPKKALWSLEQGHSPWKKIKKIDKHRAMLFQDSRVWILIQCPYRHLICVQNFVLHIFELHIMFGWFYVRICSTLGSVDPIFQRRGEKKSFFKCFGE